MKEISLFYGFEVLLQPEVQAALADISGKITEQAVQNTWQVFTNPTGQLAGSIAPVPGSLWEAQVGVGVPYGRRQELGGGGLTDSLGRIMTNPAKPYLRPAMESQKQYALQRVEQAVEAAFARMRGV